MNLGHLLTERQIIPEMRARDHWPAIVELIDHLEQQSLLEGLNKNKILASLAERENQTSTGIGSAVAIPHAFSKDLDQVLAVFGRSDEGIDFESLDNVPVKFIVLFVVPQDEYRVHLRTLAAIAKMFAHREVREELSSAKDAKEILTIIRSKTAR